MLFFTCIKLVIGLMVCVRAIAHMKWKYYMYWGRIEVEFDQVSYAYISVHLPTYFLFMYQVIPHIKANQY